MPFVPANGILEVFVDHSVNDVRGIGWVLHYETTSGIWSPSTMADFGEMFVDWYNTEMKPLVSTATLFHRLRMRDLTTATSGVLDYTTGLPITGTATGQPTSNNVALSVKKNSGLAGRSLRGRIYQLGLTETHVVGNTVETTYQNAVIAAWQEALLLSGASYDYGMVIVSKYVNNAPRASALVTPVASISVADSRVDTRRDRL